MIPDELVAQLQQLQAEAAELEAILTAIHKGAVLAVLPYLTSRVACEQALTVLPKGHATQKVKGMLDALDGVKLDEGRPPMKDVKSLSKHELETIVQGVVDALYLTQDGYDPDKPWDQGTVECVAELIDQAELRPDVETDIDGRPMYSGMLAALDDDDMEGENGSRQHLFCCPAHRRAYLASPKLDDHESYSLMLLSPKNNERCRTCGTQLFGLPEKRFNAGQCPICGKEMTCGTEGIDERICDACVADQEHGFD